MRLEALLLSSDPKAIPVLRRVLRDIGMELQVCADPEESREKLARQKFDSIIVDCDDLAGATEELKAMRQVGSNRSSIAFAMVNGGTSVRGAFEMGANFVLDKPLTLERTGRSFRAALGLILRERRRYFRYPIEIKVWLAFGNTPDVQATTTNLSEGGMAIRLRGTVPPAGTPVKVTFALPNTDVSIEAKAEVQWSDALGRAGLRFCHVPEKVRSQLEQWLGEKMEEREPVGVGAR